jgi:NAD(P)-dependent dehydrogenase (short-subunit alcohol dehydrogenase family)
MTPSSPVRVAIVTGANRGIGKAIAVRLAQDGMRIVLTARDSELLKCVGDKIRETGGSAIEVPGDLRDAELPAWIVAAALEVYGRIDVLVNNAGATKRGLFLELSEGDWVDGFALKFFGAVRLIREAWPYLKSTRGSIVNIAGIGGRTPGAEFTIGGSVNAALLSLTKALADQGITDGVQVNAINPGRVRTDRLTKRIQSQVAQQGVGAAEAEKQMIEEAGITRFGEPGEIADFVAYLVSPQGRFFQGSLIDIDGGETKTL